MQQLASRQIPHQPMISRQKVILRQVFHPLPPNLVKNPILQVSTVTINQEKLQRDHPAVAIRMLNLCHRRTNLGVNPELFIQLTKQSLLAGLSRLHLATRKLPLERHRMLRPALTNQQPIPATN